MTVSRIRVKLPTKFPSNVTAASPLVLDKSGGTFAFSLDINTLQDELIFVSTVNPVIRRYVTGRGTLAITPGCTLLHVQEWAGGGGGSGINNTNFIPQSQYGGRGGDGAFDTFDPVTVTITPGATTTINWPGHNKVGNQSMWFTTTGALPSGLSVGTASTGTLYYIIGSSITTDTFRISSRASIPFPGDVQPEVVTSAPQSGVHSAVAYRYIVQGGGGGGIIGDQGTPLAYIGFATDDPDNCSWAINGGSGGGTYGQNVGGGAGGGGYGGGSGQGGIATPGNDLMGGGGAGAGANRTASGGTGGASGSYGEIWKRPTKSLFNYMIGDPGTGGTAGAQTVAMTIASPAVFTLVDHGFMGEEEFTLTTTGALPTGLALATTYYVLQNSASTPIGANTFYVSATFRGSVLNTTGSQSGVHTLHSGNAGADGGRGSLIFTEFFGV
jgi:hypothetical protein